MTSAKPHFNESEVAIQTRLGFADEVAAQTAGFVRESMPDQHRTFFNELPFVLMGLVDQTGRPWAIPHFGKPGFITSPSAKTLVIDKRPQLESVLDLNLDAGQKIGLLGIQLETRRRNRMNGVINSAGDDKISITVDQSFGNCPQYIQTRELDFSQSSEFTDSLNSYHLNNKLDSYSKSLIETSNTFFIASRSQHFDSEWSSGLDVSHRGGKPGFVSVSDNTLLFPDFSGNRFFNTLGNIESDGRVGLVFTDFTMGDALFLTGTARVIWDPVQAERFQGAQRLVEVEVSQYLLLKDYLPMRGQVVEYSPMLNNTATWTEVEINERLTDLPLRVNRRVQESTDVLSIYLESINPLTKLPAFQAGQFLPIRLNIGPENRSFHRRYTLSNHHSESHFRISVKRQRNGIVSNFIHNQLKIGDRVHAKIPAGKFHLPKRVNDIVMISMGIGITPMMSMLEELANRDRVGDLDTKVHLFHGARSREDYVFKERIDTLNDQHDWLKLYNYYSIAAEQDASFKSSESPLSQLTFNKRLSPQDVLNHVSVTDTDFYLCGSESFMREMLSAFKDSGVSFERIHYEFFGEGSIQEIDPEDWSNVAQDANVYFNRNDKTVNWTKKNLHEKDSLLELAEGAGLSPDYGCRNGSCGACVCRLESGAVIYPRQPEHEPNPGEVVLCCARPKKGSGSVVLDL